MKKAAAAQAMKDMTVQDVMKKAAAAQAMKDTKALGAIPAIAIHLHLHLMRMILSQYIIQALTATHRTHSCAFVRTVALSTI